MESSPALSVPTLAIWSTSCTRKARSRANARELLQSSIPPSAASTVPPLPVEEEVSSIDRTRREALEIVTLNLYRSWLDKLHTLVSEVTNGGNNNHSHRSHPITAAQLQGLLARRNRLNLLLRSRFTREWNFATPAATTAAASTEVPQQGPTGVAETLALQLLATAARFAESERQCGLAFPIVNPASVAAEPKVSQQQVVIAKQLQLQQQPVAAEPNISSDAALTLLINSSAAVNTYLCDCAPIEQANEGECSCARHLLPPSTTNDSGLLLSHVVAMGSDLSQYAGAAAANKARLQVVGSRGIADLSIAKLVQQPASQPALLASSPLCQPRLVWCKEVVGQLNALLAQVGEAANLAPHTKAGEIKAAYDKQLASDAKHQSTNDEKSNSSSDRILYRSPLLVASEKVWKLLQQFHTRTTSSLAGGNPTIQAQLQRYILTVLVQLGQVLLKALDASFQRVKQAGREILPLLIEHQQAFLLSVEFRKAVISLQVQGTEAIPIFGILSSLQAGTSKILEGCRQAVYNWCARSWVELCPAATHPFVRQHMPAPLAPMHQHSVDKKITGGGTGTAGAPMGEEFASPLTVPSSPLPVSSTAHPANTSSATSAANLDRTPTALYLMIEEYFLPVLPFAAQMAHGTSSGLFLSAAAEAILDSFEQFLLVDKPKINQLGAAKLNVELRWLYHWFHFYHVRVDNLPFSLLPSPFPAGTYPVPASLFLSLSHDLSQAPKPMLEFWRQHFTRLAVWQRMAAAVQLLLLPNLYRSNGHGCHPADKKKAVKVKKDDFDTSIRQWSLNPSPVPAQAPPSAANPSLNKVAPMPPSNAASPAAYSPHANSDARPLGLTDMDKWLSLSSMEHASAFQMEGANGKATCVDWPEL